MIWAFWIDRGGAFTSQRVVDVLVGAIGRGAVSRGARDATRGCIATAASKSSPAE